MFKCKSLNDMAMQDIAAGVKERRTWNVIEREEISHRDVPAFKNKNYAYIICIP